MIDIVDEVIGKLIALGLTPGTDLFRGHPRGFTEDGTIQQFTAVFVWLESMERPIHFAGQTNAECSAVIGIASRYYPERVGGGQSYLANLLQLLNDDPPSTCFACFANGWIAPDPTIGQGGSLTSTGSLVLKWLDID